MNIVLRTAALVPLTGLIPLGLAFLSPFRRLVPVPALAHPGRHPSTGR